MPISSVQSKMARAALGLGVRDIASMAKVAPATISRFEAGAELKERTLDTIQAAYEAAGVVFIPENGGGAGVRLKFNRREVKAIDALENEGGIVGEDDV